MCYRLARFCPETILRNGTPSSSSELDFGLTYHHPPLVLVWRHQSWKLQSRPCPNYATLARRMQARPLAPLEVISHESIAPAQLGRNSTSPLSNPACRSALPHYTIDSRSTWSATSPRSAARPSRLLKRSPRRSLQWRFRDRVSPVMSWSIRF